MKEKLKGDNMAPGPIPRNYALQTEVDELKESVERMTDSLVLLIDVIKLLTHKIYSGTSPESEEEIFNRASEMVNSWEEK